VKKIHGFILAPSMYWTYLEITKNHTYSYPLNCKKYDVFWWFCLEWPSGQKKTTALLPATLSFEILVCHPSKSSFFYANWGCHSAGVRG